VDTYLKARDMDRAVKFYETFLGIKAEDRYANRWTSITEGLGLYNPNYDIEHGVPMTKHDRDTRQGNSVVAVFVADDVEGERDRIEAIGATGVTEIVEINLMAPYKFFQCLDTEGNLIEIGKFG
jgi:predicted enzyme related to lactoylglutathione lyase